MSDPELTALGEEIKHLRAAWNEAARLVDATYADLTRLQGIHHVARQEYQAAEAKLAALVLEKYAR